jgi:hypothetical protein
MSTFPLTSDRGPNGGADNEEDGNRNMGEAEGDDGATISVEEEEPGASSFFHNNREAEGAHSEQDENTRHQRQTPNRLACRLAPWRPARSLLPVQGA